MRTIKTFHSFLAALCLLGLTGIAASAQAGDTPGVVIQISENNPAVWNLALNNVRNIQQEMGKGKVSIEMVAYGPGINMFKWDSEVATRLKEANENGVMLSACGNTMKAQKLTTKDLDPNVKVVKAGVIEIMNREKQGWAYIKP